MTAHRRESRGRRARRARAAALVARPRRGVPGCARVETWGADRVGDADRAGRRRPCRPRRLSADELLACCWDDPGRGAGHRRRRRRRRRQPSATWRAGHVGLREAAGRAPRARAGSGVGRRPARRGRGLGVGRRAPARCTWAASAPFYLWPGVDVRALAMLCLAEAAGYRRRRAALNMSVPTTFRAPAPDGSIEVRRVLDDDRRRAVEAWSSPALARVAGRDRAGPSSRARASPPFDAATGPATGFACHSVNRAGVVRAHRHRPGAPPRAASADALLGEVCKDLMVAGYADIEICWIGPMGFYAAAGGAVSRVFRSPRRKTAGRRPLSAGALEVAQLAVADELDAGALEPGPEARRRAPAGAGRRPGRPSRGRGPAARGCRPPGAGRPR